MKGVVCPTWKGRKPSREEQRFGEWAAKRGLFVWLDVDEAGNETIDLAIEEEINGNTHAYWIAIPNGPLRSWPEPELWLHYEKLLRAGWERYKEQQLRFPWWEHVP